MSTLTTRNQALQDVETQTHVPETLVERKRSASRLSRLLSWYKVAVSEPVSDTEEAEWQKYSF